MPGLTWRSFIEELARTMLPQTVQQTFIEVYASNEDSGQSAHYRLNISQKTEEAHLKICYEKFQQELPRLAEKGGGGKKELLLEHLQRKFAGQQQSVASIQSQRETPQQEPTESPAPVVGNLQSIQVRDSAEFFGRDLILREIHTKLQEQPRLALVGMGGVGKTEASVQYATAYTQHYPGGTWWLSVPQGNIGGQVLSITVQRFQNFPADVYRNLPPTDLAQRCWQEWYGKGRALVVLDDVAHIGEVQAFLPKPAELVVLLTSREALDLPLLRLDVLGPIPALQLLFSAMGKPVPKGETLEECLAEVTPKQVPALCQQMGCLPLALELIGKYLKQLEQDEEPLSIPQLILQLEGKGLRHGALKKENYLMNGQRGVAEAFELSWARLRDSAQRLAELLVPYQVGATIPHDLLEAHTQRYLQLRGQDYDHVMLREDIRNLRNRSLLKGNTNSGYSIHPLVHRFFKDKLEGKL
jgi:hypothetical protein